MVPEYFMARAIKLAVRGLYTADPNPRVGCVLVKDGNIVGEGWHKRAGSPHAEIHALRAAGEAAKGATAFTTLEPCSHHGQTPPCAQALIESGVTHVVAAMQDPNPLVSGSGFKILQAAGVQTRCGVLEQEAETLNLGFCKRMRTAKPWVRVKLAASLDGRTAMASGESVWISGEAARRDVQFLRARSSCILTGSGTVLKDDPSLNVRLTSAQLKIDDPVRQPLRVVLDSLLRVPADARIYQNQGEVLVFTKEKKQNKINKLPNNINVNNKIAVKKGIDLSKLLDELANREINEVHVEAGSTLCGALLSQKLVDEIVLYTAPHIMGDTGKPLFHIPEIQAMRERITLKMDEVRQIGSDIRLRLVPQY